MTIVGASTALVAEPPSQGEFSVVGAARYDVSSTRRWVFSHILGQRRFLALFLIFAVLSNIAHAQASMLTGQAAEEMLKPGAGRLLMSALGILAVLVLDGLASLIGSYGAENIAKGFQADARQELYLSLLGKSQTFHGRQRVGDIMARATEDTTMLSSMIVPGASLIVEGTLAIIVPCAFLGSIALELLVVPLLFVVCHVFSLRAYMQQLQPVLMQQRREFGQLNAGLEETVSGIEVVKASAREDFEREKYGRVARALRDNTILQGRIEARYLPLFFFAVATGALFLHCLWLHERGVLRISDIIAAMGLMAVLRFPTFISIFTFSLVQAGLASSERILGIIGAEADLDENTAGHAAPVRGEIEFENVSFAYGERNVLSGLSFRVQPGQTVAVVGQTGSGKTTLTALVNRTYDPSTGRVLVDGVDTRDWSLHALRSGIGKIEQDIFLFSRSVAHNIGFSRPGATREQIEQAARDASADGFIRELDRGYDTVIGQRGATLSGGQRQRIALARAFSSDPRILILDDSTSAIDSATEDEIQRALWRIQRGRTTLLITHRLSLIRWADVILVLDQGRLVASGNHDRLLRASPPTVASLPVTAPSSPRSKSKAAWADMGFFMDGLDAEAYDKTYRDGELLRRVLGYFKPEAWRMLAVSAAILLNVLCDTALPIYIANSLDQLARGQINLALSAGVIIGLGGLGWLLNYARRALTAKAVGDVVLALRRHAFDAVLARDLSFYDQFASGKIVSRVNSDSQAFSQVVVLAIDLASQLLLVLVLLGYLFSIDAGLTWLMLGFAPFIVAAALTFRRVARKTITQSRRVGANVSAHIQETVSGIGVAKTFRQEHTIYREFLEVNAQSFRVSLRTGYVFSSIFPALNVLAGAGRASLAYFAGMAVTSHRLSVGDWYLFIQGVQMFWFPLTSVASFWSQFQQGLAAAERVFALIDAEPRVVQTGSQKLVAIAGEIRFEDVEFAYSPGRNVLPKLALTVRAGETLALVGHTGSGKSSIAKLVARFYEFQGGRLLIDGHDIRSLDLPAYRARLGMVTQTPFLFVGSVLDNIRYGKPEASDAQVEDAARHVGGGDWIRSLPEGLLTPVGERGGKLSMGQRQLVALARVLLQDPAILILDEATASVDPLTETLIQEGVDAALARDPGAEGPSARTSIVIAHRLSTVKHADRIIVLEAGRIIEQGTHESLLSAGGHYAELYNTYFRHQSLDFIEGSARRLSESLPSPGSSGIIRE